MSSARHRLDVAPPHPGLHRLRVLVPVLVAAALAGSLVLAVHRPGDGRTGATVTAAQLLPTLDAAAVVTEVGRVVQDRRTTERSPYRVDRRRPVSRSAPRVVLTRLPRVTGRQYRTDDLNLWPAPRAHGKPITVLREGGRVAVTGVRRGGFAQIVHDGQVRWVNQDYLSTKRPAPASVRPASAQPGSGRPATASGKVAGGGLSFAPCPDGSGTESGLTASAVRLFRAACNAFPALSTYGGYDNHGEHSSGRAIDFMTGDHALGQALADWARAHAGELNLYDVIYYQHIWTPVRASEGWRAMPNRGSATANHYDHVHISVN